MMMMRRVIEFLYQTERGQTHGETERERSESASVGRRRREASVYIHKHRPDISTQIFEYTTIQERSTFLTMPPGIKLYGT